MQHHLQYQLRSARRFRARRADLDQSDAAGGEENAACRRSQIAGRLHESASGRRQVRQPECFGASRRAVVAKTHRHRIVVRYRGAGPAMRTMTANAVHHLSALVAIAQIKEHAFGLPTWRQSPIDDVNFANLKADIEKNGILEPILIFEGRSYRAAKAVGRLTATKRELTSPLEPAQQSELKPPAAKLIKRLLKPPPQAQQEAKTIEGPQINAALQVSEEHEAKAEPLVPLGFTQSPTIAAAAYEGALCLDPATPFDNAQKLVSSRAWHPVECTRT